VVSGSDRDRKDGAPPVAGPATATQATASFLQVPEDGSARRRAALAGRGRYAVRGVLGEGGMGVVFDAWDDVLRREVALKVMREEVLASPPHRERFLMEARAVAAIDHPNLVRVYDVDPEGLVMVLERIRGESLRHRIAREGALPERDARQVVRDLLHGLGAVHAVGIIHRDIKPSNILLTEAGTAKLTDFGVAKLADSELTRDGQRIGTPAYMAPEQLRAADEIDARADLYAVGLILYEMLAGERYHAKHASDDVAVRVRRLGLGPSLAHVLEKSLAEDPARRFQSSGEMLSALDAPAPPEAAAPREPRPPPAFALPYEVPPGRVREGIASFYSLDRSTADALLAATVAAAPDDATAAYYLALSRGFALAPPDDARQARLAARRLTQPPPRDAILEALDAFEASDWERAKAVLAEPRRRFPHDWELAYALGESHSHAGEHEAALALYEEASRLAPHFLPPSFHAMDAYLVRGEAALFHRWLANLERHAGSIEVARSYAVRWAVSTGATDDALRISEAVPESETRLFVLAALGRFEEAAEVALSVRPFQRGIDRVPDGLRLAGLAWARGDRKTWRHFLDVGRTQTREHTAGLTAASREYRTALGLLMVNEVALAEDCLARAREHAAPAFPTPFGLAFALLGWRRGDVSVIRDARAALTGPRDGFYLAEVTAAIDAIELDLAGRRARALDRLLAAIDAAGSASVLVALHWLVATLSRDVDAVAFERACAGLRRPTLLDHEWLYALDVCRASPG
jgi:serine/threonine-protein kinase